jgi:hypothetical protein
MRAVCGFASACNLSDNALQYRCAKRHEADFGRGFENWTVEKIKTVCSKL